VSRTASRNRKWLKMNMVCKKKLYDGRLILTYPMLFNLSALLSDLQTYMFLAF
jgi:hypothetical protein